MSFDLINKQRRLPGYDYASDGYYFVTITTKYGAHSFGEVIDGRMRLSPIGKIARRNLKKIVKKYASARLDEFIVMPNHVHVIVDICRCAPRRARTTGGRAPATNADANRAPMQSFGPLIKDSLSSIINHYKGAVKKECNKKGFEYFFWHSRFHDHIIRSEESLYEIRQYIRYNPKKWELDRNNKDNLYL